jgi:hypothetical protein
MSFSVNPGMNTLVYNPGERPDKVGIIHLNLSGGGKHKILKSTPPFWILD